MSVYKFNDSLAWQKVHILTLLIYKLTKLFPKDELFGLVSQLHRAAISVPSNIAEGFKREGKNDSIHFYSIAQGSLEEVRYQLLLSRDLAYIKDEDYMQAETLADETGKLLAGWSKNRK